MHNDAFFERYQRQIILPGFGIATQQQLSDARVLVIGAGGLGCPVLQYLAAAGVGNIGIADGDTVSLNNLHRQVLFQNSDIGKNKAEVASGYLRGLNPEIQVHTYATTVTTANLLEILGNYNIVVDGTDNFATRYMLNDACVLLNKILVYAAISRFEGQVAVFNFPTEDGNRSSNYRDIFPQPPKENEILNCAEAGVIGVLPGIIGSMQANEVIKIITGIGQPLVNQLLTFNALNNQSYTIKIKSQPDTYSLIPQDIPSFQATDYEWLCSTQPGEHEIDAVIFNKLIQSGDVDIVDVRELHELPRVDEFKHLHIPLANLSAEYPTLKQSKVVVFCQTGKRSQQAVKQLSGLLGKSKTIVSLQGGILAWKKFVN